MYQMPPKNHVNSRLRFECIPEIPTRGAIGGARRREHVSGEEKTFFEGTQGIYAMEGCSICGRRAIFLQFEGFRGDQLH